MEATKWTPDLTREITKYKKEYGGTATWNKYKIPSSQYYAYAHKFGIMNGVNPKISSRIKKQKAKRKSKTPVFTDLPALAPGDIRFVPATDPVITVAFIPASKLQSILGGLK